MGEYEELLERAFQSLPKTSKSDTRFQIPEAEVTVAGSQTVVKNLRSVASALNRDPTHLAKFLLRELAAAGALKENQLVVQGKFPPGVIQERINRYVQEYVLCKECGKPDTRLEKIDRILVLRCEACGARTPVRGT